MVFTVALVKTTCMRKECQPQFDTFETDGCEYEDIEREFNPELFKVIKAFLTSYLPHIKKCSKHTVEAYKYALNIYFEYLSVVNGISLTRTKAADFSQQNIVGFMEWLLNSRNNIATTANQRLTHLSGF